MKKVYDVIIVGAGVAGLYAALHIPEHYKVLVICKGDKEESDSFLAQGGISTLRDDEDFETYYEDTMKAGHYENDGEIVKIMIEESRETIEELMKYGVVFDKIKGELSYTREGAHRRRRILHYQDMTGKAITSQLISQVEGKAHITFLSHTKMIDLISENNEVQGIVVERQGKVVPLYSQKVILATGGIGGLFENSTNYQSLTGDGVAVALKHQVALRDVHYIQIHPTTLYSPKRGKRFLISEAVRGEGGILLSKLGERFVDELLPRDLVCEAIYTQMQRDGTPYVRLALMHLGKEKILRRFPNIYKRCEEEGYDLLKEPIPVCPAQHYFMGGIASNEWGETSMKDLYAVGETCCNGVHGKNRLASNSLLESLIFAKRAVAHMLTSEMKRDKKQKEVQVQGYALERLDTFHKELVLEEIKRRDGLFYDKWCQHDHQCG